MKKLIKLLDKYKSKFKGNRATEQDLQNLKTLNLSVVNLWIDVLKKYNIIGESFSLSEEYDLSDFGVELQIMTVDEQMDESLNLYPGIASLKKGYLPLGICLEGSGDPYFIKDVNSTIFLYRIPHNSLTEKQELLEDDVELVNKFSVFLEESQLN
jgi:hypothetical protein